MNQYCRYKYELVAIDYVALRIDFPLHLVGSISTMSSSAVARCADARAECPIRPPNELSAHARQQLLHAPSDQIRVTQLAIESLETKDRNSRHPLGCKIGKNVGISLEFPQTKKHQLRLCSFSFSNSFFLSQMAFLLRPHSVNRYLLGKHGRCSHPLTAIPEGRSGF
jgi:hypothetical protein